MNEIKWKLKDDAFWGGDEFWYDITDGGYIRPIDILEDESQIELLENAIAIVKSFEDVLEAFDT